MSKKCPKCQFENTSDSKFCKECGTQLPSIEDMEITETLETPKEELTTGFTFAGRYQIIEELGKGGMGRVFRALDKELNEEVALKLIKPEIAKDKKTIERFKNELKIARRISHRNVGRMYELMEDRGSHFITMEYVPGQDLRGLIRQTGQLSIGTTINLAKQVCDGLEEAHHHGVVHRDLKPSNIIIDRDGNARILDFGIAKSIEGKAITGASVMIGTPEYMSPEQVEGKDVDKRSDIYSLGIILYEMATGKVPFEGDTPFAIGVKHKSEFPKDPKEINSQIPNDLNNMILKCLEKDKDKRCQSAGEVRSELANIEKGIPTTERIIPDKPSRTSKEITVKFTPLKLLLPAILIIMAVIVGFFFWRPWSKETKAPVPSDKPSLAIVYFENVSGDESLDGWRTTIPNLLTTDLMQSRLIKVLPGDRVFSILKKLGLQDTKKYATEDLVKIADEGGVNHTINGSYIQAGENIIITLVVQKPHTGEVIHSHKVTCRGLEEIAPKIDELTRQVKMDLELSQDQIAGDIDKNIESLTTDSLEALMHYQKGLDALYRFFPGIAHEHFQKAVDIDPTFAMAYVFLALSSNIWAIANPLQELSSQQNAMERAKKYAYKVTDREKGIIDGYKALIDRDFDRAYDLALKQVEAYPDDKTSYELLSTTMWFTNHPETAVTAYEKILEMDPSNGPAYNGLSYFYYYLGDHSEAISAVKKCIVLLPDDWNSYDSVWEIHMKAGLFDDAIHYCEEGLKRIPDHINFQRLIGISLLLKGSGDQAREKFRLSLDLAPNSLQDITRMTAYSFLFEGKYRQALAEFEKAIRLAQEEENPRHEIFRRFDHGKMLVVQKKYDQAIKEFALGEELSWKTYDETFNPIPIIAQYLIGRALVKKGDFGGAEARAGKIKLMIEQENFDSFYLDFYYLLLSELNAAQRKGSIAQEYLDKTSDITKFYSPHFKGLEAAVFALNGEREKAAQKYRDLYGSVETSRRPTMGDPFDFFRGSSLVDYSIAKIYETMGNELKAIERYEKFLDLWKDADPGIAEVEDARKMLAGLKSR